MGYDPVLNRQIEGREMLAELSRLNSFVRSATHHRMLTPYKSAVYLYKREAIASAARWGWLVPDDVRFVEAEVACRNCTGGVWHSWSYEPGDEGEPCRTCGATGRLRLRFMETTIREAPDASPLATWHTPVKGHGGWDGEQLATRILGEGWAARAQWRLLAPVLDEWRPDLPGEDMTAEEAAHALNVVEGFLLSRSGTECDAWQPTGRVRLSALGREVLGYKLDLGWDRVACGRCGTPLPETPEDTNEGHAPMTDDGEPLYFWCGEGSELYRWTQAVCRRGCGGACPTTPPVRLLTEPALLWAERRARLSRVLRQAA